MHFTTSKENCGLDLRTERNSILNLDSPQDRYPDYCRTLKVKDNNGLIKELVFPKALDLDRPKRARTTFSAEQLHHLEQDFQRNQYLVGRERTELAHRLNLSETQVKVWFQNRRTKYKRDKVREAEDKKQNAESLAACNILRLLQGGPAGSPDAPSSASPGLEPPAPSSVTMAPHSVTMAPPSVTISPVLPPTLQFLNLPPFFSHHETNNYCKP